MNIYDTYTQIEKDKKLILKFDIKDEKLRMHMYKEEGVRISGECTTVIESGKTAGYVRARIDNLILQMNDVFGIGFEKNTAMNIRGWIKANIYKIYIRSNVPNDIQTAIHKLARSDVKVVVD